MHARTLLQCAAEARRRMSGRVGSTPTAWRPTSGWMTTRSMTTAPSSMPRANSPRLRTKGGGSERPALQATWSH
eukprot:1039302-Amphidinium_carterae.1